MKKKQNRREFLQVFARGLVLTGIVAGSGYLIFRPEPDGVCNYDFLCKDCRKLSSCKLPEAERHKTNVKKQIEQ